MSLVLVVDDDTVSRTLHRHVLRRGGHEVIEVAGVDAALRALAEHEIDVVVADYLMPEKSGLDLVEEISAGSNERRPAFILVTGVMERADLNDARATLVDGYLTKPVSSRTLLDCVDALLA